MSNEDGDGAKRREKKGERACACAREERRNMMGGDATNSLKRSNPTRCSNAVLVRLSLLLSPELLAFLRDAKGEKKERKEQVSQTRLLLR